MAVSIQELLKQKDAILAKKEEQFDIQTSIGTVMVKKASRSMAAEIFDMSDGADEYAILNLVVTPNLKDAKLQEAYGCVEPTDIVGKLFDPGEVPALARKILECAGYGKTLAAKVHEDVKN